MTAVKSSAKLIDVSTPAHPDACTIVDEQDYAHINRWKWHIGSDGYVQRSYRANGKAWKVRLARLLLNAPPGKVVDHINGDPLDNRRANLRLCTPRENSINCRPNAGRRYKGVYKHKKSGWEAAIGHQGRRCYLGLYRTPDRAAIAYDVAAKALFGEYATTNYPDSPAIKDLVDAWHEHPGHAGVQEPLPIPTPSRESSVTVLSQFRRNGVNSTGSDVYNGFQVRRLSTKRRNHADHERQKRPIRDTLGHSSVTVPNLPKKTLDRLRKSPLSDYYWANKLKVSEEAVQQLRKAGEA